MDSVAIEEANKKVTAIIAGTGGKRHPYLKLTDEQQATIGCYAAEHGTVNAIRCFKEDCMILLFVNIFQRVTRRSHNRKTFLPQTICIIWYMYSYS